MSWQVSIHLVPMLLAVIICLGLLPIVWRYREHSEALWMSTFLSAVIIWTVIYSLQVMSTDLGTKELLNNFRYPFVSLATIGWMLFALSFTHRDRWITYRLVAVLLAIPVITQFVVWTNAYHGLMRASTELIRQDGIYLMEIDFGTWFWVHAVHAYILTLGGIALMIWFAIDTWRVYRTQAIIMTVAVLLPFIPAVLVDFGVTTLDYTPVFFSVTAILIAYALLNYRLLDVVPVARKSVVDEMSDSMFVLDLEERVVDLNDAAADLLETTDEVIGEHIDSVFPIAVTDRYDGLTETTDEIALDIDDETRYFTLRLSRFRDEAGEHRAWLLVLQDVTAIKTREQELEVLNRVVRHDIQNDMNVVLGYAELADERFEDGEIIDPIIYGSRHAIELTETVRDLLQSITGEGDLELEAINLADSLDAELQKARATHEEAEFEVEGEIDPELCVRANNMISSIFTNLFTNAVRHNDRETPKITVAVEEDDETIQIRIADNGPGVPDEDKGEIFGQGQKGLESRGTGVGLYLVETLTTQFGGTVRIEDNEPRGAVFVVELERARVTQPAV